MNPRHPAGPRHPRRARRPRARHAANGLAAASSTSRAVTYSAGEPSPDRVAAAVATALGHVAHFAAALPAIDCYRLLNGAACGLPGLVIERFGPVLIVQVHEGKRRPDAAVVRAIADRLRAATGAVAVYEKFFPRRRDAGRAQLEAALRNPQPWLGDPVASELPVHENGVAFLIRPYDGYSTGLFLEQRENRGRIRQLAAGRRVLNLFAYTCGFAVAAGLGGAAEVTSVDVSKKHLEWGRRNLAANGLSLDVQRFIAADVFDYFRRALRQGRRCDLLVIDPPTFGRARGAPRPFALSADLPRLAREALQLLDPGGLVLLCTNHRGTTAADLQRITRVAAGPRPLEILERPALPFDFADDPGYASSILARLG